MHLIYGSLAFTVACSANLIIHQIQDYGITTGIHVHNLDNPGIGFVKVIFAVVIIGFIRYSRSVKRAVSLGFTGEFEAGSNENK